MICDYCEKTLTKGDSYIKFEDERICSDCSYSNTIISYFVDGEFIATDDDGVEVYDSWDVEELEE